MKRDPYTESCRFMHPTLGSGDGNNGCFVIPYQPSAKKLTVICSDGGGWDHVSVSLPSRCPTWDEMNFIKNLFFDSEEAVMQLHPPKSMYKNLHKYCLHLWRPQHERIPLPNSLMVAP